MKPATEQALQEHKQPPSHAASRRSHRILHAILRSTAAVAVILLALWGACALWFQLPEAAWRIPLVAAWAVLSLACAYQVLRSQQCAWRWGLVFAVCLAALLAWWHSIAPSHDRIWADDVAHLLQAEVDGNTVTLNNVRNFEWRSETDYTPRWESRSYDLNRLQSADLVVSYWMGPHIAHTLVSFGFDDGQRIVFSLEIRKERGEAFSAVRGFFRQYEQILVAADERDIIQTRSNARGEEVYLYSLNLPPEQLRAVFLGYLQAAQALSDKAEFYNTLTSNCTTIVFELAKQIAPTLRPDYRLLLSGHFAEYAYDQGALVPGYAYADLQALGHINARALRTAQTGEDFSQAIRQGMPQAESHE